MVGKRKVLKGTPISGGVVLGYARVMMPGETEVAEVSVPISRLRYEVEALEKAVEDTLAELRQFRDSAGEKAGGPVTKIFDAQLLIAGDYEFLKQVKREIVAKRRNAGFVYNSLVKDATAPLRSSADPYMRQMALDIEAVAKRVLSHLSGYDRRDLRFPPNTIVVGRMLTPGDVLGLRQRKAVGFLVSQGGKDSHMALITRALMIPMVLAKDAYLQIPNNCRLIIDGAKAEVIVNPTDEDWTAYQKLKRRQGLAVITRIKKLTRIPPVTADGMELTVGANLTLPGPADEILARYNFPVGLYRTEFLYLANYPLPDEETQYEYYSRIAEKYANSWVIIRTFDLGYDKLADDSIWPQEDNPALGWRGIRVMLEMSHIFKTQVRAILRASTRRNLKIILPLISDVSELEKAKKLVSQVKFTLRKGNIPFDKDIDIGVMVEVPSAAMTAATLAQKADFISIGTNDLTQYTLAADRMNAKVADLYSSFHPAVLKLIHMTVEACKRLKKPVSICGEFAGDLLALPLFIGMGVDMLSMHPAKIFDVCRLVRKIDSNMARHLLNSVITSSSREEALLKLQHYKTELGKKRTLGRRR